MISPAMRLPVSLLVLAIAAPAAIARGAIDQATPGIESVKIDPARNQMQLRGQFFKPNTAVLLGKQQLEVIESSQTRIVAKLPPDLPLATFVPQRQAHLPAVAARCGIGANGIG
jgi:hypothetical protein